VFENDGGLGPAKVLLKRLQWLGFGNDGGLSSMGVCLEDADLIWVPYKSEIESKP
jgi:hypothetical protein